MTKFTVAIEINAAAGRGAQAAFRSVSAGAAAAAKAIRAHNAATGKAAAAQGRFNRVATAAGRIQSSAIRRTRDWTRETRRLDTALGRSIRQVEKARLAWRRLARERAQARQGAGNLSLDKIAGGVVPAGAVARGFSSAMDTGRAQLRLKTVINDKDVETAYKAAVAHAHDYSRRSLASEVEILNIQYALNSAGLTAAAARAGSEIVHQVSKITGGDSEQVGEVVATVFNNLGDQMAGTDAEKFQRVGELLTKAQFKFQIRDFGQLGESFKEGASALARFNVPLAQGTTLLGALNSAGLQGGMAGTSLSATLRQMTQAAEKFNFEIVRGADGQMDVISTLENLRQQLDGFDDIDARNDAIQEAFGDEGAKGLILLLTRLKDLRDAQRDVEDGSRGLIAKAYADFEKSFPGKIDKFTNAFSRMSTSLVNTVTPALALFVDGATAVMNAIDALATKAPALGTFAVAAAAFTAWKTVRIARAGLGAFQGLRNLAGGRGLGNFAAAGGLARRGIVPVRVVNAGAIGGGFGGRNRAYGGRFGKFAGGLARGGGGLVRGMLGRSFAPLAIGLAAIEAISAATDDSLTTKEKSQEIGGAVGGGLGGLAGGALAGAAIGSVIPVVGTAIGGLIGGALGYFGGDWLGRQVGGVVGDWLEDDGPVAPAMAGIEAVPPAPVQQTRGGDTVTTNITINPAPGMSERDIGREVVERQTRLYGGRIKGERLFD